MIKVRHHLSKAQIAVGYDSIAADITMPEYFYPQVVDFIGPLGRSKVLDIGCGNGIFMEQLLLHNEGIELNGLDVSKQLAEKARLRLGSRVPITESDVQHSIPFDDAEFDLITATEVLEHLAKPSACLREVARLLKPNGRLIVTLPNASAYFPFMVFAERYPEKPIVKAFLPYEHPSKTHQPIDTVYNYPEILYLFKASGFRIRRVVGRESFQYLADFVRVVRWWKAWKLFNNARLHIDQCLNFIGLQRFCYRLFIECTK